MFYQAFFAWRVHVVSRQWIVPVIAWTGSALRLALAVVITYDMSQAGTLAAFDAKHGWIVDFVLGVHASVDLLNTAAMFTTLAARRHELSSYVHFPALINASI